jgi:membrane associated rhomboid family serine protease
LIELNHILLFLALLSPLAVLGRTWRPGASSSWRLAAFLVLLVTGVAYIFWRENAGYVGAGAWLALLFLPAIGLKRVTELSAFHHYAKAQKLATALLILHPSRELREQVQLFGTLARRQAQGLASAPVQYSENGRVMPNRLSRSWVVVGLIIVNCIVFAIEGTGSTDPIRLSRLGALDPILVIWGHQYWRLFTALFLHYGALHLLFNLFALYVLGPPLERAIGSVRFLFCYLVSGLGSSAGVVFLTSIRLVHNGQLVGASGCVMGIVGAWAGFLLRNRHLPGAGTRLKNIATIVVVQFIFDISTPQVSMSAHLCGLATGFFLGLLIGRRQMQ